MSEIRRIGIVCDGQLGRMMVEDGLNYDPSLEFTVLGEAGPDSPAAQVGATQLHGSIKDPQALRALVESSDVTTWEIEHINAEALIELESEGHNIQPSPRSLLTIQDKLTQKQHLVNHGIEVAPFAPLDGLVDLYAARTDLGQKLMVKSRRGGYDGRGNYLLHADETWENIEEMFPENSGGTLYAEKLIPFRRELALVGVRDMAGRIATYPVVETIHRNNICHTVIAGDIAEVPPAAEELGRETIKSFDGAGVFAVEMFETEDGEMVVNEVAPRVHNSGHWTDIGAVTSQFEQHIRAIIGAPLGSTAPLGAVAMINILGTKDGIFKDRMRMTTALEGGLGHVRWYGKSPRPNVERKIGHVTALGEDRLEALNRAEWLIRQYAN